jgi:CRP-like cAMP-binding protein
MSDSQDDLIRETIDQSPLFKHLSEDWRGRLIDGSSLETYQKGNTVVDEGQEEQQHLFIVIEGKARVWTRSPSREVELKTLSPGAYFGEVSLLSEKTATATVEPATDTLRVVALDRKVLLELIEEDEKVRKMLEGVTLARAKDTIGKVME